jgi:uncharacterized protein YndB with AHSA1/START domain
VPTARVNRTIASPVQALWEVIGDPHHLPRWWPRVERVEDVEGDAFTEVMRTAKGKVVRADFRFLAADEGRHTLSWAQQLEGTPFERLLKSAETEVLLVPAGSGGGAVGEAGLEGVPGAETEVTIELRQTLNASFSRYRGFSKGFGSYMVRRAATATLKDALDGLERISPSV